ncbi:SusC/RagA family TonB-linked outer membrane protein [Taibaiella chishuiensis]|uniref:TonB-linked SusC/RagA family outer membrane protein n=1 Tax=Taibaiella chishuiensis TaxID=1434707 RepID=A0A2P8DA32_9BACT|nr:SusC/RagA family TonB-linked outer membrane protein [Taibaiella chishuiensis]PSK94057.1 TonB-linked SusC/RagA family outer membrane protein [Taibaiella chishuiensis]
MKKMLLLFALFLWSGVQAVMAQTKARGTVLDEKKEPVPGAAVKVVGTSTGTVTDADGNFEVEIPEGKSGKLEISATGYSRVVVNGGEGVVVNLEVSSTMLNEAEITVPYGPPVTKEKYVGAADRITSKQIDKMPVSDITKAIEGAAPGIQVTNGGGQPGSGAGVRMRGTGSLSSSNAPLYVLDGTPYVGDITSLNPQDIESITLLKDATATSLYGSRGANGVIAITTKKGRRNSKPRITVDGKVGIVQRALPNYDIVTDQKDYYVNAWQAFYNQLMTTYKNDYVTNNPNATPAQIAAQVPKWQSNARNLAAGYSGEGIVDRLGYNAFDKKNYELLDTFGHFNQDAKLKYQDDWFKELQRTGFRQDYNLAVDGGSETSDYRLSFGYLKEDGFIKYSNYDRFTTRINVNSQVTDWLKAGINLSGSLSNQRYFGQDGSSSGNPSFQALQMAPIYPVYYRDSAGNKQIDPLTGEYKYDWGSVANDPESSIGTKPSLPGDNILGSMALGDTKQKIINSVLATYLQAKFLKNFTFSTNLNLNYVGVSAYSYSSMLHGQSKGTKGFLSKYAQNDITYTWNQLLSWQKQMGAHNLSLTAGHEFYSYNSNYVQGVKTGFPGPDFRDLAVATTVVSTSSRTYDETLESWLASANYDYDSKYFLSANVRRDGSSRFYKDSRWGTFWSVGGAWHISREDFLKDVSWLNLLKLKVSYGTQGNNQILNADGSQNYYAWQGLYALDKPNGNNSSAIPKSLPNTLLTWEKQKQLNAGFEANLFDRIYVEFNYFDRRNNDLLYNRPFPRSTGFSSRVENIANMYNRGVEINLNIAAVKSKDFRWDIGLNWTKIKNAISKMPPGRDSVISGNIMLKAGHSRYEFYLVESAGVDASNGDELYYYTAEDGTRKTTAVYSEAINSRKYMGSAMPDFSGAITNTLSYKGFELSFLFTYGVGGKYYDGTYSGLMGGGQINIGETNFHKDVVANSWTPENTGASLPRLEYNNPNIGQASSRWLVDASYLNLRNVNLSYTFSPALASKAKLSSLRAYVAVDNAAFWSKRKGMNPQATFDGEASYVYVPARTIMFGLNLGL